MYYFDNSATTQPLPVILETVHQVHQNYFANPSSAHLLGQQSHQLLESARTQIAQLLAFKSNEIYFTASGTESNNWVLQAIVRALHKRYPTRNRIIVSAIEHPAIMKQLPLLEKIGFNVELCRVDSEGCIDLAHLASLLEPTTLLVSTMAVNNEVGTIQPLAEIAQLLSVDKAITWHVDGVQAPTCQLDLLRNARIDLLTLSSHKFHAIRGAGLLAIRQHVATSPLLYGGGQEKGQRSSTENLASIVAMAKALRLVSNQQNENQRQLSLYRQAIISALSEAGWQIFGGNRTSAHIICAALVGVPGEVLVHAFEQVDIYVSTTSACASRKHQDHTTLSAMGVSPKISTSAIRISMGSQTNRDEVTYLCQQIGRITQQLRMGSESK